METDSKNSSFPNAFIGNPLKLPDSRLRAGCSSGGRPLGSPAPRGRRGGNDVFLSFLFFLLLSAALSCARTPPCIPAGSLVPDFSLTSTEGTPFRLSDHENETVVLIFWSANCPITKAYERRTGELYDRFALKGIPFFAIDSNADETVKQIRKIGANRNIPYPILLDPDARVADMLSATRTPEIFILTPGRKLVYQGAIDNETWAHRQPTVHYAKDILSAILEGKETKIKKTKPYGRKIHRSV